MTLIKNDRVAVINEDVEGVVVSVQNGNATVETSDGFLLTYKINELVKVNNSNELKHAMSSFNADSILRDKTEERKHRPATKLRVKGEIPPPEFDLHIEKLVKNFKRLSNYEVLTMQTETAQRHLEFAIHKRIPKIVFIHGVGEGILKAELDFLLRKYRGISFREANYQKYGQGATEVIIGRDASLE